MKLRCEMEPAGISFGMAAQRQDVRDVPEAALVIKESTSLDRDRFSKE